uniref:Uncharacterized protein n=1 Tax=Chromera velia CCMP2878 TaxID=1169474 RepID=A0A0G4FEW1_9ALVE|eukprot:Cvel_16639.t1-p1 / transcript=Cvel_16639.t1 / gene=Cvel_16639 / organism=Chromera_velia_CCMP2878 / gene_product=hypothetical protein / transcript_product=hypothetical protein / location=Cvel_scaffold1290:14417-16264(+) / protein_length=373 / sequence_SO=supercontig / SO=protein_coding / is_pseudo=false
MSNPLQRLDILEQEVHSLSAFVKQRSAPSSAPQDGPMEDCPRPSEDFVPGGEVGVPLPQAVTVNKPNVFDGKHKHLTSWIRKVKRYFRLTGTPVERQLDLAINYLNDVEQNYIEDLEEKQGVIVNTLNDLFAALRKKFVNPKEQEILRKELYAVKFSPSKGVVEGEDLDAPYAVTIVRAVDEVQEPQPRMIWFQGILEGTLVRVLLDSGAHELFISSDFCHTRHFLVRPLKHLRGCKGAVKVDRKEAFCQVTECTAPLKLSIQDYDEEMKFTLAKLDNEYDIFLSMKWLEAHNPQIDWKEKSMTFPYRGQLLTLWGTGGEDPYGGFVPPPISARGAERAIQGGAIVHIFKLAPRPLPSDPCVFSEEQCFFSEE